MMYFELTDLCPGFFIMFCNLKVSFYIWDWSPKWKEFENYQFDEAEMWRGLSWCEWVEEKTSQDCLAYLCKIYHIDAYSFFPKTDNFPRNVLS